MHATVETATLRSRRHELLVAALMDIAAESVQQVMPGIVPMG
jgi:hypothetical protein